MAIGPARKPAGDFRLAHTGPGDHRDVLGAISHCNLGRQLRRRLFRKAMARRAAAWPITYLSSSTTISRGVSDSLVEAVVSGR
jgi:hypothetical protein